MPSLFCLFLLANPVELCSIIMLNTDLHNPNIPDENKMTLAGFVSNNRGIDNGQDISKQMLAEIYEEIKTYVGFAAACKCHRVLTLRFRLWRPETPFR